MFGVLDRYVGKNVLYTVLIVTVILTFLTTLITFVDRLRYLGRGSVDFLFLTEYILMQVPGILVMFFPIAVLIGGVVALGSLAKTSELIVLQSIGVSRTGIVLSSLKILFPVIVVVLLIGEFIVPRVSQYAETKLNYAESNGAISLNYLSLWLKEGESFIGINTIYTDGTLNAIVKYDMHDGAMKAVSYASKARYENGAWQMYDVTRYIYNEDKVVIEKAEHEPWKLNLTPERVAVVREKAVSLSVFGLMDYIEYLEENNQDASKYKLDLYGKFLTPLNIVVMLLLAASTVFGPLRQTSMGVRILGGISLGFMFYLANRVGVPLSLVYGIPPLIGASAPTLAFLGLALYVLSRKS